MSKYMLPGIVLCFLLFIMLVNTTSAATVNATATVDLDKYVIVNYTYPGTGQPTRVFNNTQSFLLDSPISVGAGDHISLDIAFADGKSLTIYDLPGFDDGEAAYLSVINSLLYNNTAEGSGTVAFQGVNGTLLVNPVSGSRVSSGGGVGPGIITDLATSLTDSSFSFAGLHAEIDVLSLTDSNDIEVSQALTEISLFFLGSDFSVGVTAAPLPPALWLFASGLLGLIGISRRKKGA